MIGVAQKIKGEMGLGHFAEGERGWGFKKKRAFSKEKRSGG